MKRKGLLLVFILTVLSIHVNAQLQIDAGEDRIICVGGIINENEILYLGGNPTITGGKEPYTYTWSGKRKLLPSSKYTIYASDILNDTTLSNPTFEREKLLSGEFTFYLKVEDSDQLVAYDSVKIQSSSFVAYLESARSVQIQKGDSVRLFGTGYIDGDFHPLQFYISPSDGLSDSSDLYGWVKPLKTTHYSIHAINSVGCVSNPAPYLDVSVISDSKEFAPIGAEWYYEKMLSQNPPEAGYIKLTSVKDSTIENKAVRVIEVLFAPNDTTQIVEGYEYLHQSGDTIWYWKNKQFHMLYNFAMQKGDSILLYSEMINQCSMNDPYGWNRVDSVFTHTYNGLTLKSYTSSPINQSVWGFEMHTSEIIGNLNYLIPQNKGCSYDGIAHGPLRCYSDPVHGVLFTSMPQMKCDSTYTYTGPIVPGTIMQTFIDPNRRWTVSEKTGTDSETLAPRTLHFRFGTDSLVAGLTYSKMLLSNDGSNWQVHSLCRLDSQNNIYHKRGLAAEVPIYNFMLKAGDRFGSGDQEIVIDSTQFKQFGTVQRKHLYGHYANMPNRSILWIDGIGSMFGPHINDNFFLVGGDYALICVEEAGQQIYLNPNYKSCKASDFISGIDHVSEKGLFENRNRNQNLILVRVDLSATITINPNPGVSGHFQLMDTTGKTVQTLQVDGSVQMSVQHKGIYLYVFTTPQGMTQTGKLQVR